MIYYARIISGVAKLLAGVFEAIAIGAFSATGESGKLLASAAFRLIGIRKRRSRDPASDKRDPPKMAEFLLTALATTRRAEAMIGDLNERFTDECKKFGRDRAVRLYWARTLRSLGPLLRRAIGKALKWGAVIAAVRRLF
jgi:hypothetical protein